jgi:toxin CptA
MLLLTPIPLILSILLCMLLLISMTYFVMLVGLLGLPWSWKRLLINSAGECHATQKNGANIVLYIMPDSFVSAYLTILHVVPEQSRWFKIWRGRYIIVLQDNCDAELFRQLRVHLRWRKSIVRDDSN